MLRHPLSRRRNAMTNPSLFAFCFFVLSMVLSGPAQAADQPLKPYLLGSRDAGTLEAKVPEVKAALEQKGFQIVGDYAPYAGTQVIVATSDALRAAAAKSDFGAYGAVVRVSVTNAGKELQ